MCLEGGVGGGKTLSNQPQTAQSKVKKPAMNELGI